MNDVLGHALNDYLQSKSRYRLWIHNKYGKKEQMPLSAYFRSFDEMTELEMIALEACTGKVLDVGAAAGSHALILQQRKLNVTALDISEGACYVMQERGVKKVITADIFHYKKQKFDTLLFLMNGIGLAGTVNNLRQLLTALKNILKPGAQILFDSSDVAYLYDNANKPQHYYGEIDYMYEYRNKRTDWFAWLYIDKQMMEEIAAGCGYTMKVLLEDEHQQYVARLKLLQ